MTDEPIAAATALADTLAQENQSLRRMQIDEAMALLGRKRSQTDRLEAAHSVWTRGVRLPPERLALARTVAARLDALAAENKQLLERAIAVQAQVIAMLLRAVPAALPVSRYGAGGGRVARLQPMALSSKA